jgi:zinc protease
MQRSTPLILVLILAVTAMFLSLRSGPDSKSSPAAPSANAGAAQGLATYVETKAGEVPPAQSWSHASSDIAPDPKAVFGQLPNGMRYLIYPNSEPPGRISLRLHIAAGSLMEAEDQRGLAHFLEHMVFNGTKHHTAAELIPRMQRLGIAFGAHANAYTSFDETVYMLDLPDMSEQTMKLAFTVMRDFGDGALLDSAEIDKERGVILSEKISRDSVGYRLMQQQFSKVLPDSLVTRRFPIGEEEIIRKAPRESFADLYTRYYTPNRMTFVVAGDVKPEEIRSRIESAFASMQNPKNPGAEPELGSIKPFEGIKTSVFSDKEVDATEVSLTLVRDYKDKPDTAAHRIEKMPLDIAHAIIGRRFERLSKEKNSPIAEGTAMDEILFNHMELGSIGITAADDRWREVVPILEREFRRAVEHGFSESELSEAKSNLINRYEQQVKQKATRKSEGIATVLARTINDHSVFSDPETDLAIAQRGLDAINTEACHEAFRKFWQSTGHHLILTTKEPPPNAEADLAKIFNASKSVEVEAPISRAIRIFDYADFGRTGKIDLQKEVPDLGITQLVLSNKVRINLKHSNFEQGKIRLLARIGSGKLGQPRSMPMLDSFAQSIFEGGGLGKHSNDELRQILAGRNIDSTLAIAEDAITISGATTPADLATQLQLMCASITDPGYREEALWQFRKGIPMLQQQIKHTPAGPEMQMTAWLHGNDSRFAVASEKTLASYTIRDAKKWLSRELSKGPIELSIIGDFKQEEIIPELLNTFGALPRRESLPDDIDELREINFPKAPASKTYTYETKIPQGVAIAIWKTKGLRGNQPEFRRLNILASILGDRLREEIREKLGASYGPNAGADGSDALDDMGYIVAQSVGKPEDLERLLETMSTIADDLSKKGATADELDRALKPALGILDKSLRDNNYWLSTVMSQSQADPMRLDLARNREADYRSITLEEINALAKKYLPRDNALEVKILPK